MYNEHDKIQRGRKNWLKLSLTSTPINFIFRSFCDFKDETKSIISGVYYRNNKTFQIQETEILYTKSEVDLNSFCYINMNLKIKGKFGKKRLLFKKNWRFKI